MEFVVTLSRHEDEQVTVDYETSDGTATAPGDYTVTSGTLTFSRGNRSKTVSVPIMADTVNDDGETFTLTLSNLSGGNVYLSDATATGTIKNQGTMPQAWITRFGRTVASHAVEAIGTRATGERANHVQIGSNALLPGGSTVDEEPELGIDDLAWTPSQAVEEMSGRNLLIGSAFSFGTGGQGAEPSVGGWGRVELGSFEAEEDGVVMDGEVTSTFLGADVSRDGWLAGVAFSMSQGDGDFELMEGEDQGTVESTLTSVYPYARVRMNERMDGWGLVGFGSGELTLRHGMPGHRWVEYTTDIDMHMGAAGLRGEVVEPTQPGGLALAIKSDAYWVSTRSDEVRSTQGHLGAAEGEASRIRLIMEGSRAYNVSGGTFTPIGEVGLRHDGGDAETGAGIEVGGRVRFERAGVTLEGSLRTLVAHQESGYEEWGAAGALKIRPQKEANGRGLSLTVAPSAGSTGSGTGTIWSARDVRAFAGEHEFEALRRLETRIGYGIGVPGTRGLMTPYAGVALGEGGARTWRTGTRWRIAQEATVGIEGTRTERGYDRDARHAVEIRGQFRW